MSDKQDVLFSEAHRLANEILVVRERLKPIVDGEIVCARSPSGQVLTPGKRKVKLKDAMSIAKHAIFYIDKAVNRFSEMTE